MKKTQILKKKQQILKKKKQQQQHPLMMLLLIVPKFSSTWPYLNPLNQNYSYFPTSLLTTYNAGITGTTKMTTRSVQDSSFPRSAEANRHHLPKPNNVGNDIQPWDGVMVPRTATAPSR